MAKPLVLVVDDEQDVADLIGEQIRESGKYEAAVAYSAAQALEVVEKNKRLLDFPRNRVRCIVLDIKMPTMDGLQFLEKIREEMLQSIPVIILSAFEDDEKWKKAVGHRVVSYLRKPSSLEELTAKIDQVLSGDISEMQQATLDEYVDKKTKLQLD